MGTNVYEVLAEELHKPVIIKFERRKEYENLEIILWLQIQLKWNNYHLRIEVYIKYAW